MAKGAWRARSDQHWEQNISIHLLCKTLINTSQIHHKAQTPNFAFEPVLTYTESPCLSTLICAVKIASPVEFDPPTRLYSPDPPILEIVCRCMFCFVRLILNIKHAKRLWNEIPVVTHRPGSTALTQNPSSPDTVLRPVFQVLPQGVRHVCNVWVFFCKPKERFFVRLEHGIFEWVQNGFESQPPCRKSWCVHLVWAAVFLRDIQEIYTCWVPYIVFASKSWQDSSHAISAEMCWVYCHCS